MVCGKVVIKNGHKKDMCYNEIGLCAQHRQPFQVQYSREIGKAYVIIEKERIFILTCFNFVIDDNLRNSQLLTR